MTSVLLFFILAALVAIVVMALRIVDSLIEIGTEIRSLYDLGAQIHTEQVQIVSTAKFLKPSVLETCTVVKAAADVAAVQCGRLNTYAPPGYSVKPEFEKTTWQFSTGLLAEGGLEDRQAAIDAAWRHFFSHSK